ncbi:MAG TPA: hypothetical protein G4O07_01980 [Dehalococcoidia bacterium]|nr:hypothetical protein [Dehalococcoidia bacterium]
MMKGKLKSIGRMTLAVVLICSLGLVMALPSGAAGGSVNYSFAVSGNGTAAWSVENPVSGSYSVKLVGGPQTGSDYAAVVIPMNGSMTMSEVTAFVYNYTFENDGEWGPHMCFYTHDPVDSETADISLYSGGLGPPPGTPGTAGLHTIAVDGVTPGFFWYGSETGSSLTQGLPNMYTLEQFQTDDAFKDHVIDRIQIEYGWWSAGNASEPAYVDSITLNTTTYDLEPPLPPLDEDYYQTGDSPVITIYDAAANTAPDAMETIAVYVYSETLDDLGAIPVLIALQETGLDTGVFAGIFTLVGTTPGTGELLVSHGDWVSLSYPVFGSVIDMAYVDNVSPTIDNLTPADGAMVTTVTPTISASLNDDLAGIDTDSVVMTVDGIVVTAVVTPTSVSYTPTTDLTENSHAVTVDASDMTGNPATQASWSFTVDITAPGITGQEATPPVVKPNEENTIVFTAGVTDATSGVDSVTIDLSSIGGSATAEMLDDGVAPDAVAADDTYTADITVTIVTEGTYSLTVTAADAAGNEAFADVALVVSSDIVDPVITDPVITYKYGTSVPPGDTVDISATVTDNVGMGTVTATCDAFDAVDNTIPLTAGSDIYTGTAKIISDTKWGDYPVTITAQDAKGNEAEDTSLTITVEAGATGAEIVMAEGWNLISLPLIPDDADITVVISDTTLASGDTSSVGIVRAYDPATGDFPFYKPSDGSGALAEMRDGQGYWVFMNEADTLTVTGREWPVPPDVPPFYTVVEEWNLIGFKSLIDMDDTEYLVSFTAYPVLWSYDADVGQYTNVKGDTMEVGHGFWLWATGAGTIVPPQ